MKRSLNPTAVPQSPFYAQGIQLTDGAAAGLVFVSGQVGIDRNGDPAEGIEAQTRLAIGNVGAVLAEAGLTPADVVKQTIYLTSPEHVAGFVGAAAESVSVEPPATTMLIVAGLADPRLLVEIEAVAVAPS